MANILSEAYQVRRPTMDDVETVSELLNTCDIAEYGVPDITLDELRTVWQAPSFHLDTDAMMVLAPNGQLVGYADMEQRLHAKIFTFVRVRPGYEDQGIGEHLLQLAEAWGRQQMAEADPEARVTLNSWASSKNETAQQLFERAGFQAVRHNWRMEIDMETPPPEPVWPEGITVRTFQPGMDRQVFEMIDTAFQDHWGHLPGNFEDWQHWMISRETFDPTLWFLAFEGEQIAGGALCNDEVDMDLGWVGQLAVLRPWRRKGVGLALLLHAFGEFYKRGRRKVGLGVDSQNLTGAVRLYERAGMHAARQYISYQKELRAGKELSTQTIAV
ncbi:MAG TPA: GNAT family N-acetyltransferase [Ktedonobacteraceae bacterium]|nr:GNAT family N-acetyltransferase [Ktedonobacteraceae bacterium]